MKTYATWARLFQLLRYYSWIVDRFHISTMAYQQKHAGRNPDMAWLETILKPLDFRLVLCRREPGSFSEARKERLRVSGNPRQYDDLGAFIEEQAAMERLVRASSLHSPAIDVTDGNVAAICDQVADWLEQAGGLEARC